MRDRPVISLELKARATYAHGHEYALLVRVRSASTGRPFRALQVTASGAMHEPGHEGVQKAATAATAVAVAKLSQELVGVAVGSGPPSPMSQT